MRRKLAKHVKEVREKKKVEIKREPFIECHPLLQALSLSCYVLLFSLLQDLKEMKNTKEKEEQLTQTTQTRRN